MHRAMFRDNMMNEGHIVIPVHTISYTMDMSGVQNLEW